MLSFKRLKAAFKCRSDFPRTANTNITPTPDLSPSKQFESRLVRNTPPILTYSGKDSYATWKAEAHSTLIQLLGITPDLVPEMVNIETLWKAKHKFGDVSKVQFFDAKSNAIPGYIGTPQNQGSPTRWIICLQGHTSGMHMSLGLDQAELHYQEPGYRELDIASQAMRLGYGILCIEQYSLGERSERRLGKIAPHPCQDAAMHLLLYGHTLMGIRVAEVGRIIDFLLQRELVTGLIGVAGNSLGGTVSMYLAALYSSIDFAVLSSCISTLKDSILSLYHCTDLYIPQLATYFDSSDILALIAPKPLLMVHGVQDPIFPITGFRNTYNEINKVYTELGVQHRLKPIIGSGGHKFYGSLAYPALNVII